MKILRFSGHPLVWHGVQLARLQLNQLCRLGLPQKAATCALIGERRLAARAHTGGEVARGQAQVNAYACRVLAQSPHLHIHANYFTT